MRRFCWFRESTHRRTIPASLGTGWKARPTSLSATSPKSLIQRDRRAEPRARLTRLCSPIFERHTRRADQFVKTIDRRS
jgi:hypothetical protein